VSVLLGASPVAADDYSWASRDYDYASNTLDDFIDRRQWDMVSPVKPGTPSSAGADSGGDTKDESFTVTPYGPRSLRRLTDQGLVVEASGR
jgi:hypothetical protein